MHNQLVSLNAERNKQRRRLAQYQQLRTLLGPFNDPQENLQPNLVTKDSSLAAELDRMRMLLAKVAGRISQTEPQNNEVPVEESTVSENMNAKLAKILGMT